MMTLSIINLITTYLPPHKLIPFFLANNISLNTTFIYNNITTEIVKTFPSIIVTHVAIHKTLYSDYPIQPLHLTPIHPSKYKHIKEIIYNKPDDDTYCNIDMSFLNTCTNLKHISLPICINVKDIHQLFTNPNLTRLKISSVNTPTSYYTSNLRHLIISGLLIPHNLQALNSHTNLRSLTIKSLFFDEENHPDLNINNFFIPTLRSLSITFQNPIYGIPTQAPHVKSLTINNSIHIITSYPNLTHLCICYSNLNNLPPNFTLPHLKYLKLHGCSNPNPSKLSKLCPNIECIKISEHWDYTFNLNCFKHLRKIYVKHCIFDLSTLNECTKLTSITLENQTILITPNITITLNNPLKYLIINNIEDKSIINIDTPIHTIIVTNCTKMNSLLLSKTHYLYVQNCPNIKVIRPLEIIDNIYVTNKEITTYKK